MGANFSVGGSKGGSVQVLYLGGCAGSSFLHHYLSPGCILELSVSHAGLAVVLGLVVVLVVRYSKSPWRCVPPGPRGLPLIGNVLELQDKDWIFRRDCKQKYSACSSFFLTLCSRANDIIDDMMYLNALGQPILFLNSLKVAAELLDRRSSIYSGRPRLIMAQEIISGSLIFSFLSHADESVSLVPLCELVLTGLCA